MQDVIEDHDGEVKEGATIIHHSELPSPEQEISPLTTSPPGLLPSSNPEPGPPAQQQPLGDDATPESKPPSE